MNGERISTQIFFTIALLGFWLIASTITFGTQSAPLFYSNFVAGLLLIGLGIKCRKDPKAIEIWALTAVGTWLQLAPLLFWAPKASSYINDTFVGVWIIALAITLHPIPGLSLNEKGTIPPGWSFNPSSWSQRIPIAFLAFICWMISRYLAAYQLGYIDTVWDPFFTPGTKGVLTSDVSKAFPVSDAGLGALAYTLEFFSACQGGSNRWRTAPWLVLVFGILVIPVSIVSTVLIILQPLAVGTWCTLCLTTALCMLISMPFAIAEVTATIQFLRHSKEKPFLALLFQGGTCAKEKPDRLTPPMESPILTLLESSLSGLTFPWNLSLSAILGVFVMAIPSLFNLEGILYQMNPILGAFTTVVSIVSFSECARKARYLNFGLGALLLIGTLVAHNQIGNKVLLVQLTLAIGIALLSLRKGPIRQLFSFQKT